jgi:hypothetical protein
MNAKQKYISLSRMVGAFLVAKFFAPEVNLGGEGALGRESPHQCVGTLLGF